MRPLRPGAGGRMTTAGRVPTGVIESIDYDDGRVTVQIDDIKGGVATDRDATLDIGDRVVLVPVLTEHQRRALKHMGIG